MDLATLIALVLLRMGHLCLLSAAVSAFSLVAVPVITYLCSTRYYRLAFVLVATVLSRCALLPRRLVSCVVRRPNATGSLPSESGNDSNDTANQGAQQPQQTQGRVCLS